ncbi:MAG: hypothetical protein SYR96_10490 [Actinomycetota bacterium]|nr:hypothetical protein [Actinomycetota bacterium]
MAKKWSDRTPGQRRLIIVAGVIDTGLKAAMLIDLKRRTAAEVHGPRWLWAASTVINSAGLLPAVYFLAGRRPA